MMLIFDWVIFRFQTLIFRAANTSIHPSPNPTRLDEASWSLAKIKCTWPYSSCDPEIREKIVDSDSVLKLKIKGELTKILKNTTSINIYNMYHI